MDGWTTKIETIAQPIAKLRKPENVASPRATTSSTSTPPSNNRIPPGNPNTTETLQQLIARLESNSNYNIVVGGEIDPNLTTRTVEQNRKIYGDKALGKYQIQYPTFKDVMKNTNLIFSPKTQDDTYFKLLERRGLKRYQSRGNYN
jgi:muramidase (phage lysozyme)